MSCFALAGTASTNTGQTLQGLPHGDTNYLRYKFALLFVFLEIVEFESKPLFPIITSIIEFSLASLYGQRRGQRIANHNVKMLTLHSLVAGAREHQSKALDRQLMEELTSTTRE